MKKRWVRGTALLLALLLIPAAGLAEGAWKTLTETDDAAEAAQAVSHYTGEIRMTFLGDCTLGGVEKRKNNRECPSLFSI